MGNTIGYDFKDTYMKYQGIEIAVRLSTVENIYSPSAQKVKIKADDDGLHIYSDELTCAGGQIRCEGQLDINIKSHGSNIMGITAKASRPGELCKSILILIKGIDVEYFEYDSPNMDKARFLPKWGIGRLTYPGRSPLMPLMFIKESDKEWFILSKDTLVRKKAFSAYYDFILNQPVIRISHEEDRRYWSNEIIMPEWKIGRIDENFTRLDVVNERCADLEKNFNLIPFKERNKIQWINDIKLVINFHGEHFTGYIFNTFEQMTEQLKWVCQYIEGKHIIAFLPAWDGRYYYNYPEHKPEERMGGSEGLGRFVRQAHTLGVKVVLMLGGPNLVTFDFLKKNNMKLEEIALKNEWGFPYIKDYLDWNSDLSNECRGIIANFGNPEYRRYMVESSCNLLEQFDVDGIFLDGAIRWMNSPDYSSYEGIREWVTEMNNRHPERLLMAEDGYDALWGLFGMFATGEGPLGLENAFLRYSRMTYYLAYPAENGSGGVHECAWYWRDANKAQSNFTIPTISMMYGIIEKYRDELKNKICNYGQWTMK